MPKRATISPSQIGWLRADCERCFVREVAHGIRRPGGPPDVYNLADGAMKRRFDGDPSTMHNLGIGPTFSILAQGLHVQSHPISFAAYDVELILKGRLDALVRTDNGKLLIVDYKTSSRDEIDARTYSPQLHAYALSLEMPQDPRLHHDIDGLALLVYRPKEYTYRAERRVSGLYGQTEWVEVPRNDAKFLEQLRRVAALVTFAEQPIPNPRCAYCVYYGALPIIAPALVSGLA